MNGGVTGLHLPLNFMLTVPKWVFQEREYHGVSKARKLSMVAGPHLVMPTNASLTGGCDRNSGLGKCLGKLRDVPHSHPLCPPLLGLARGTALARGLRGQVAASSPHLGVGLGQGHGAEPHKLLEGSTQTRPPLTHLTLWCKFLKAPSPERQTTKNPPSKAVHFRNSASVRVGLPGSHPSCFGSAGLLPTSTNQHREACPQGTSPPSSLGSQGQRLVSRVREKAGKGQSMCFKAQKS